MPTTTDLSIQRRYVPAIGARVKLNLYSDYTSRNLPVWSWFDVQDIQLDLTGMEVGLELLNGLTPTGTKLNMPLAAIARPIGWKERYKIHCEKSKLAEVLAWFARGIVVRQSQYIGDGSTCFQPLDNSSQPHWKFGEVTDTVPASECDAVFSVVQTEFHYEELTPKARKQAIAELVADGWEVSYNKHTRSWEKYRETTIKGYHQTASEVLAKLEVK